jgi:hypothetical protein
MSYPLLSSSKLNGVNAGWVAVITGRPSTFSIVNGSGFNHELTNENPTSPAKARAPTVTINPNNLRKLYSIGPVLASGK